MRVLCITPVCPLPLTDGNRMRNYHLVRALARRHDVTLLCPAEGAEPADLRALEDLCARLLPVPGPARRAGGLLQRARQRVASTVQGQPGCFFPDALPEMRQTLATRLTGRFDVAWGGLYTAPLVLTASARQRVLDEQNVEEELYRHLWQQERSLTRRVSRYLDWRSVAAFERRMLPQADLVTACSPHDVHTLRRQVRGLPPVRLIPNGVDLEALPFRPERGEAETLVMTGGMSYAPNVAGARLLVEAVMPRVWVHRPNARLILVGKHPAPEVRALAGERVEITGAVPDVRPYLRRATLSLVPLRVGGGPRLKVLEAMAAGVPVVSTTLGAEGIDFVPGRDLEIADDPDDFAAAIVGLLAAPERAREMALAARRCVETAYGWEAIGAAFVEALEECAGHLPVAHWEVLGARG